MAFSSRLLSLIVLLVTFFLITNSHASKFNVAHKISLDNSNQNINQKNPPKNNQRNVDGLYMVILDDEPLATYQGDTKDLAATSILSNSKNRLSNRSILNANSPASKKYLAHLKNKRENLMATMSSKMKKQIKPESTYSYALNAFTARFTELEVTQLIKQKNIRKVLKVTPRYLMNDAGPDFINAPEIWNNSLSEHRSKGEGIIIGILDSGIAPAHPSFREVSDDGYRHINPLGDGNYLGDCAKPEFSHYCNAKLIGIWSHPEITDDYTPFADDPIGIDHDGHGSHVAATAAGNVVNDITVFNVIGDAAEYKIPEISGVAPRANIVAYQVCAADFFCWPDLTALAVENAIANGIDVLNYSVGGDSSDPWSSVDALSFLSAREAGIHVAVSAGNDGADAQTISSPANAPWLTSVGAIHHGRDYQDKTITFSGGSSSLNELSGLGITSGISGSIVYAGDYGDKDCLTPFTFGSLIGKIVVCTRNDIPRVEKGRNVLAGGAIGLVLINDPNDPSTNNLVADLHVLPAIHLSNQQGQNLLSWLSSGSNHNAVISNVIQITNENLADTVADFSSRGPDLDGFHWLLPSISAPGVEVFSAYSNYQPHYNNDKKNETDYSALSGTSMSSPHIAGALALIADIHPEWSPSQAQSALMMTANFSTTSVTENNQKRDANFFDVGTGSLRVDQAVKSGLTLDASVSDFKNADPEFGGEPSNLNVASMVADNCKIICTWQRTFVASETSSWQVTSEVISAGVTISVIPQNFSLSKGQQITLTFTSEINDVFDSEYGMARAVLTPSNNNLSVSYLPMIGKFIPGLYEDDISVVAHTDEGSALIRGIQTVGTDDLQVSVSALSEIETKAINLLRDNDSSEQWPVNIFNDSTYYYIESITIPENTEYLSVKVNTTTSPDIDLYVGLDDNNDGRLTNNDEITGALCQSATQITLERCEVIAPPAGEYFIIIHNYGNENSFSQINDDITFEWAIITENNEQLTVDYDSLAINKQDISLSLNWFSPLEKEREYMGVFTVGTSALTPDNVGIVPFKFTRSERIISGVIDKTALVAGEQFTVEFHIDKNVLDVAKNTSLNVTILAGSSIINDTHQGQVIDNKMQWQINQAAKGEKETIRATFATDEDLASTRARITYSYTENGLSLSYLLGMLEITAAPVVEEPIPEEPSEQLNNSNTSNSSSGGTVSILFIIMMLLSQVTRIHRNYR